MGVLIQDIERPTECGQCRFFDKSWTDGRVAWCNLTERHIDFVGEVDKFCPLIPVDVEDEGAILLLAEIRKALRENKPKERNCKKCIYARKPDDPYDNGCTAWDCEFIPRAEAIKVFK